MQNDDTAKQVARWVALGALFLIPFTPLLVANTYFFPFITGKAFYFRILVEIAVAGWAVLALLDKEYRPRFSWISAAVVSFVVWMFIADAFAPNAAKAFWSNFERMEGWVTLAHLFALFVVLSSVMTRKLWEWLFRVSVGVSLIVFVYGSLQLAGKLDIHQGGVRLDATFGNATYLAIYMLFHIFLNLLLLAWSSRGSIWRWFYGFAIFAEMFILYHTATRGAILGLIGGLFLTALLILIFLVFGIIFYTDK